MAACGAKKDKAEAKADDYQENYNDGMKPADRMNAIKVIFIKMDKDGDKLLTVKEWCAATKEKDGDKYDEKAAKAKFKAIDKSGGGTISLAELDLYVAELQLEAVCAKFKAADDSGDRKLDKKEFGKFFRAEGMKNGAIKKLWKNCDKNGDGKVSYMEFKTWMEREMADGALKKTFKDFNMDADENENEIRELGKKNQAKKDAKNAKAQADAKK